MTKEMEVIEKFVELVKAKDKELNDYKETMQERMDSAMSANRLFKDEILRLEKILKENKIDIGKRIIEFQR